MRQEGQSQTDHIQTTGKELYDWAMAEEHRIQLARLQDTRCRKGEKLPVLQHMEQMCTYPADVYTGRAWIMMQNNAYGMGKSKMGTRQQCGLCGERMARHADKTNHDNSTWHMARSTLD